MSTQAQRRAQIEEHFQRAAIHDAAPSDSVLEKVGPQRYELCTPAHGLLDDWPAADLDGRPMPAVGDTWGGDEVVTVRPDGFTVRHPVPRVVHVAGTLAEIVTWAKRHG